MRTTDSASSDERSKFYETGNYTPLLHYLPLPFPSGHGENTSSISWLQDNALVAGMGSRYLKVFDIRGNTDSVQPVIIIALSRGTSFSSAD